MKRPKKNRNNEKLVSNIQVINAVQQPNSKFVVEGVYLSPGKQLASTIERVPVQRTNEKLVVVMAKGMTSADKPVPDIPSLTGFPLIYNPEGDTSLILEPSSKAIAGNGGIAISAPISRALIRQGTSTKVLWRPQSVAIAGVGGTAHAHSDLIIDYLIDE